MAQYVLAHSPAFVPIPHKIVADTQVSATDLGVYIRFAFAESLTASPTAPPSVDMLVHELRMPREEVEAALQRLAQLGHLEVLQGRPKATEG